MELDKTPSERPKFGSPFLFSPTSKVEKAQHCRFDPVEDLAKATSQTKISLGDNAERPIQNSAAKRALRKRKENNTPQSTFGAMSLAHRFRANASQHHSHNTFHTPLQARSRLNQQHRRYQDASDSDSQLSDTEDDDDDDDNSGKNSQLDPFQQNHQLYQPHLAYGNGQLTTRYPPPPPATNDNWQQRHHDLPFILSGYIQMFFNLFIVGVILYVVTQFIMTIQRDVDLKVDEYSEEILQEMSICTKNFIENRCSPDTRVPAMQKACAIWESCMNRDPKIVGRAKVSAETFAEIINSFIEPISYKTMTFFAILFFCTIVLSNFAFHFIRTRSVSAAAPTVHPPPQPMSAQSHSSMLSGHLAPPSTPMPQTPHYYQPPHLNSFHNHHQHPMGASPFAPPNTRRQKSTRLRPKFNQSANDD
ncbi:hypothetical protein H4R33_005035 [Dimargaris cristalligena]|nr:hypothetical protein H4R33_005035 [Dimargaris cristalligena]